MCRYTNVGVLLFTEVNFFPFLCSVVCIKSYVTDLKTFYKGKKKKKKINDRETNGIVPWMSAKYSGQS